MRGGIVGLERRLAIGEKELQAYSGASQIARRNCRATAAPRSRGNGIVGLRRRYGFNISLKNITFTRHDTDSDISERPAIDADEERRAGGHDEVLRKRSGIAERTLDQFDAAFDPDENPAPERLAAQLTEFRTSYNALNDAYALTRESLITQDIAALDEEGDQLFLGLKETVEAARRMTYLPQRKQAGDRLLVFLKKYQVDVRENMIAEWAKLQQMTEEAGGDALVRQGIATLGLSDLMARLTAIAAELRLKLTQRSASLPAQQAMKQAHEAIYPEYRTLIQVLNAFVITDSDPARFAALVNALNNNIDYVRKHAMAKGAASDEPQPEPGGGSDDVTPVTPEVGDMN